MSEMMMVSKGLMERLSGLFPEGAGNDGSGRIGFLPHVTKTVDELRALLASHIEEPIGMVEPVLYVAVESIEDLECVGMHATRVANDLQCVPLFTSPPAPASVVPVEVRDQLNKVWLFLDGQTELSGCVFGEKPEGRHQFWWRKELRAAIDDLNDSLDKVTP
jgi:hypothetical protein